MERNFKLIKEPYSLVDGSEFVITVVTLAENFEAKINFGKRADSEVWIQYQLGSAVGMRGFML